MPHLRPIPRAIEAWDGPAFERFSQHDDRGGLVKSVGDKKYGEILGAHICSVKRPI